MAILGVKVQLHMIVTGPQGTLGSSTSPWSTYTYAAPALAGTGARTDVDADNTYTFSVDGINFGAEDSTLGSPGSAELCKSSDTSTPGNGACFVVSSTTWSHTSASFTRTTGEWAASDFPGTLQITVGARKTDKITIVQAPPSFDDDDNKAAVRTKISQTDGMQVDAASTRDSFLLKIFNVGNGDDLENQLVIYLAIEGQTNPKALYGCTSGGTNHAGTAGCTNSNGPSSLAAGGWAKGTCTASAAANTCTVLEGGTNNACAAANADSATCSGANDAGNAANNCVFVDVASNCEITIYIPEGQGTDLPLYASYGGANSGTIGFGGYAPPSIANLKVGTDVVSAQPNLDQCSAPHVLDATGGVLTVTGNNFGLIATFEFCVVDPIVCGETEHEQCCTEKNRWTSHTTSHATVDSSHTVLSATMASGIGMNHLLRINVGGQASPSAAICFKAPSITSVTTVPAPLPTGAAPGSTDAGSPGKLVIVGTNFGTTAMGWISDASNEHYKILYQTGEKIENGVNTYAQYKRSIFVDATQSTGTILTVTDTQIEFAIPAGQGNNHALKVQVGLQESATSLTFAYDVPTITDITPKYGPTDGSTLVAISGTNFGTQTSVILVQYYYDTFTYSRSFSYDPVSAPGLTQTHDHVGIAHIPMPAGQGKANVDVTVTVNGQVSPKFTIVPPTDKVTVPGYPNPISVNGAYLPPRVDSMLPTSGPTSGCRKFEEVQLWEERMAAGDTEGEDAKRKCEVLETVTFEGVSFGLSGPDAGDMYVEMRSLGHEWSSEDTTCAAPSCEIIASGK